MSQSANTPQFIAVDIGNSRIKLGRFASWESDSLPVPSQTISLSPTWSAPELCTWLKSDDNATWFIASVNRTTASKLLNQLRAADIRSIRQLSAADISLQIQVDSPDQVGIDRLANALAVNRLRDPQRSAIAVDVGSAITVDLVSAEGAFVGGAILPGIAMSARALHEFTDLLPSIVVSELIATTAPLGKSTDEAMRSGLFWGAVGAIREIVALYRGTGQSPQVFLTGGAAPAVAELFVDAEGQCATYVPHLTLGGIALVARDVQR